MCRELRTWIARSPSRFRATSEGLDRNEGCRYANEASFAGMADFKVSRSAVEHKTNGMNTRAILLIATTACSLANSSV